MSEPSALLPRTPLVGPVPAHWGTPLAVLLLLLGTILLLYSHTLAGMVAIWSRSDTYAHGFVVPLISLWLVWRLRQRLAPQLPRPSPLAALGMLGAAALWLAGDLVAVNAATQLALVALLVLAVPTVLGWPVARTLAFPLGFLFFAVPMGDFLLPRLMEWTADFTVLALRFSGIPVYREGLQFVIPSGTWSVVEACSGIRYLIASLTVGALFAYLNYRSLRKRWLFMGVALLVPLLANWLRAYGIVLIGHLSGNELATGVDHLIYGWVFFGIVIMAMLLIGARWADAPLAVSPVAAAPARAWAPTPPTRTLLMVLLAWLVVIAPHGVQRLLDLGTHSAPVLLSEVVAQAPWQTRDTPVADWTPAFVQAVARSHGGYTGPRGEGVGLHLSYYRQQDYQRKLVSSENTLVTSKDPRWARVASARTRVLLGGHSFSADTATLRLRPAVLGSPEQRLQVWRFYWVNGRFTASDVQAKLHGALSRLLGRGDDGAIVAVYTPLNPQLPEARARAAANDLLQAYLQAHETALQDALQSSLDNSRGGR
jgi:exosortase A